MTRRFFILHFYFLIFNFYFFNCNYSAILFISNAEALRRRGLFFEFDRDLESKTLYGLSEVLHWLTCRPNLCVLRIFSIEWKTSLRLCVSAFFIIKVFR